MVFVQWLKIKMWNRSIRGNRLTPLTGTHFILISNPKVTLTELSHPVPHRRMVGTNPDQKIMELRSTVMIQSQYHLIHLIVADPNPLLKRACQLRCIQVRGYPVWKQLHWAKRLNELRNLIPQVLIGPVAKWTNRQQSRKTISNTQTVQPQLHIHLVPLLPAQRNQGPHQLSPIAALSESRKMPSGKTFPWSKNVTPGCKGIRPLTTTSTIWKDMLLTTIRFNVEHRRAIFNPHEECLPLHCQRGTRRQQMRTKSNSVKIRGGSPAINARTNCSILRTNETMPHIVGNPTNRTKRFLGQIKLGLSIASNEGPTHEIQSRATLQQMLDQSRIQPLQVRHSTPMLNLGRKMLNPSIEEQGFQRSIIQSQQVMGEAIVVHNQRGIKNPLNLVKNHIQLRYGPTKQVPTKQRRKSLPSNDQCRLLATQSPERSNCDQQPPVARISCGGGRQTQPQRAIGTSNVQTRRAFMAVERSLSNCPSPKQEP